MLRKNLDFRLVGRNIYHNEVVYRIGYKLRVVDVRVVVVTVVRNLKLSYDITILIDESDLRDILLAVIVHRNGLGLIRGDRAVVTSAAVIVEYESVASPEFVA